MQVTSARKSLRLVLWFVLLAAATEFATRGPVRFMSGPGQWNDLSQNYVASKLWLQGQSPANPANFVALWKQQSGSRLDLSDIRTHLAPPLSELVVLAPIAVFPWKIAKVLWLILLLLSFSVTVWALVQAGGFREDENRTLWFVAACLALAPFHTGLAGGNPTVLVIGLCAVAILAAQRKRDFAAGILFGLACSLKPQLGAFLVLYYLVRRRWHLFAIALSTTLGLALVAIVYLQLRGASWLQDYLHNARGFVASNRIDDFSSANPGRFTLINLQVPFFSITGQSSTANLLALAVGFCLICAWLYWVLRRPHSSSEMLPLAATAIIGLLPVYHRFYDAGVLVLALCWCIAQTPGKMRTVASIALLLMIPFLAPGASFLEQLAARGRVPDSATQSFWWSSIVMPHETWILLMLSLLLLYAIKLDGSRASSQASSQL